MNKLIYKILPVLFALFIACEQDDTTEGISRITYYADMQIIGDKTMVITEGDSFTDPGVNAIVNGESVDYSVEGTVNSNKPGVYKLTYININTEGFKASATRAVIVLSSAPSKYSLEGNWKRNNGSPVEVVKISDREYTHSNAGGVVGPNQIRITFYNVDDTLLYIPYQENTSETGISVESVSGTIVDNDNFNWVLNASSFYGALLRVFTRV